MNHPEFKNDAEKLLGVLKLLGDENLFKEVDSENSLEGQPTLKIGDEIEENQDVGMVSTKIKLGEGETSICLIGPKRMDYDEALSALEYLKELLNDYFNKKGGDADA